MPALQLVIELDDKGSIKRVDQLDRKFDHLTKSVQGGSAKIAAGWGRIHASMSGMAARLSRISLIAKIALAGFAAAAIVTGAKFEQSMANVASVAGATDAELLQLSSTARFWGKQTAFSANEAADAMYSLASAGMKNIEIQSAVGGVLQFAGATASDLGAAAEQTVQALKMFGLQASETDRVINVFAGGISASMLTAERLADSLGYVGGTAKAAGLDIETTVSAIANLHDAGLMGMRAGTGLKNILAILSENGPKLTKVLGGMSLETHSLADIMGYLAERGTSTNEVFDIFGRETAPAVFALMTAGAEGMKAMTAAVTGTNKAAEMYEKQMATVQNQLKIFKSAMQENMIAVFMALKPLIMDSIHSLIAWATKIKPYIIGAVTALADFVKEKKESIKSAVVLAAKILGLVAVTYVLAKVVAIVTAAVHLMSAAWMIATGVITLFRVGATKALFNVAMTMELFKAIMVKNWAIVHAASIGPWGILIAIASAVLAALVVIVVKNMDHIKLAFSKVGEFIVTVSNKIRSIHASVFGWIANKASWLSDKIQEAFRKPFDWIWSKLQWLADKAGWMMDQIVPGFTARMEEMRGVVADKMGSMAETAKDKFNSINDAAKNARAEAELFLGGTAIWAGEQIASAAEWVGDKTGDMIDAVKGKIPDLQSMIASALGDLKALGAGLDVGMAPSTAEAAKAPPERDFSAQMLASHAARLQTEHEMSVASWTGGIKVRLDLEKAAAIEGAAYNSASTVEWLDAKRTLAAMEMSERVNKENATAAQIAEARIAYDATVMDAEMAHREAVWEAWLAQNEGMLVMISGLSAAYDTMVDSALDKEMTGKKRREVIWKSMQQSFLRGAADMLKKYLVMHIKNLIVASAVEESINVKRKFTEAKIGAVKAYQAFAAIPIIGPILGAAAAAAAFAFLMAFHKGGPIERSFLRSDEGLFVGKVNEYVIRSEATRTLGRGNLDYMNATGRLPATGGSGSIGPFNFTINADKETAEDITDFIEDQIVPMIEGAIGRRKLSLKGAI